MLSSFAQQIDLLLRLGLCKPAGLLCAKRGLFQSKRLTRFLCTSKRCPML